MTAAVADLLGDVAEDEQQETAPILVERAVELARSGQLTTAATIAEPLIERADLHPPVRTALARTAILALSADARVAELDRLVAGLDRALFPPVFHQRVAFTQQYVRVLSGDVSARRAAAAADLPPAVTPATGTLPLVMKSIAAMLATDGERAVELAEAAADGYRRLSDAAPHELASVDVWPTRWRPFTDGRADARRHLADWRRRTTASGQAWVEPYHQSNAAMLALAFGEIDHAAADFDGALSAAGQSRQGWTSSIVAARSRIDVVRDDLDAADDRLQRFRATNRPSWLGLGDIDLAVSELAVARGETSSAHERSWSAAIDDDNRLWMILGGLDIVRVARRLGADPRKIVHHLAGMTAPPALRHVPMFAVAMSTDDTEAAVAAVDRCRATFSVVDAARLLGVRGKRARPATGWASLTATEARVVALLAEGKNGPEIGRQLYISPRTVQTHVTHAMRKLGLTNRVELATAYADHVR